MQEFIRKYFGSAFSWLADQIGKVEWRQKHSINEDEKAKIMEMLKKDYYIIVTRHGNHLSTYAIALGNFILTGKWSFYSHVLMNLEDEAHNPEDFRLMEAVGNGVRFASWDQVFADPDAVCLLKPTNMTIDKWTLAFDKAKSENGKPYDTLFDLANDKALSCVELIRVALEATPDYNTNFRNLEEMIAKNKNLTPQMFRDCPDFEVVFEIKK